jgi:transcriptional regulator with XRE-family HTH domain
MSERVEALLRELASAIREEVAAIPENVGNLGEEVARARKSARLSLQEVGDASGFTKSHVWEVEQGRSRNPTVSLLAGLSRALGVPFHRLAEAALNTQRGATAATSPSPALEASTLQSKGG